MQKVIELGRVIRDRKSKPLKQPLRQLTIVHPDTAVLQSLQGELSEYIYQETNVRELATCSDPQKFGSLRAEPVFAVSLSSLCILLEALATLSILDWQLNLLSLVYQESFITLLMLSNTQQSEGFLGLSEVSPRTMRTSSCQGIEAIIYLHIICIYPLSECCRP